MKGTGLVFRDRAEMRTPVRLWRLVRAVEFHWRGRCVWRAQVL